MLYVLCILGGFVCGVIYMALKFVSRVHDVECPPQPKEKIEIVPYTLKNVNEIKQLAVSIKYECEDCSQN